jgi:hypothetical protein
MHNVDVCVVVTSGVRWSQWQRADNVDLVDTVILDLVDTVVHIENDGQCIPLEIEGHIASAERVRYKVSALERVRSV